MDGVYLKKYLKTLVVIIIFSHLYYPSKLYNDYKSNCEISMSQISTENVINSFSEELNKFKNILSEICKMEFIEGNDLIKYLFSTVSLKEHMIDIHLPIPLFIDSIAKDIEIKTSENILSINDISCSIITLQGYVGSNINELINILNNEKIFYRFVSRFIFFNKEDAKKESKRYFKIGVTTENHCYSY